MRGWLIGMALVFAGAAVADDLPVAPPSPLIDPYGGKPLRTPPEIGRFALGNATGKILATRLDQVKAAVGSGATQGVAGTPFNYLCYDLPAAKQRVWLSSTDGAVDAVTVKMLDGSDPVSKSCPELPARFGPVVVDGKVRLNMSKAELVSLFGQPSIAAGNWLAFHGITSHGLTTVTVRLAQDKAVFLYAAYDDVE